MLPSDFVCLVWSRFSGSDSVYRCFIYLMVKRRPLVFCTIRAQERSTIEHIFQRSIFLNGRPKPCLRYAGPAQESPSGVPILLPVHWPQSFLSSLAVSFSHVDTMYFPSHPHVLFLIWRSGNFFCSLMVLCLTEHLVQPSLPLVWAMQSCDDVL